jgi:hypothetical protein
VNHKEKNMKGGIWKVKYKNIYIYTYIYILHIYKKSRMVEREMTCLKRAYRLWTSFFIERRPSDKKYLEKKKNIDVKQSVTIIKPVSADDSDITDKNSTMNTQIFNWILCFAFLANAFQVSSSLLDLILGQTCMTVKHDKFLQGLSTWKAIIKQTTKVEILSCNICQFGYSRRP